jgi:hypothetical protein
MDEGFIVSGTEEADMPAADDSEILDGPFGNADAARVNLDEFISVSEVLTDPRASRRQGAHRIIAGRKGSGKTFYLRALQDAAKRSDLLTLSPPDTIGTETVVFFLKRIREYVYTMDRGGELEVFIDRRGTVISVWRTVWERAIDVSVFSLVLGYLRATKAGPAVSDRFPGRFQTLDELEEYVIKVYSDLFSIPLAACRS